MVRRQLVRVGPPLRLSARAPELPVVRAHTVLVPVQLRAPSLARAPFIVMLMSGS